MLFGIEWREDKEVGRRFKSIVEVDWEAAEVLLAGPSAFIVPSPHHRLHHDNLSSTISCQHFLYLHPSQYRKTQS